MPRLPNCVLIAGFFSATLVAAVPDPALSGAQATLQRLPLRFEANQGQWMPGARYGARAGGYMLLLSGSGPSVVLPGARPVEINLAGSNAAPEIEALDRLPVHTDYIVGRRDRWRTGISSYSRIRYKGVYPGIDVVYYGNQRDLEYDFVLAPGADPRAIRLRVKGQGRLSLTPEGDLALEIDGQRIVQKKPLVYQQAADGSGRKEIAGRYALLGRNTAGVRVDRYDPTRPLVIDPVIAYCTYFGSPGVDEVTAMKLTPNGRLYITGTTSSAGMQAAGNAYNSKYTADLDIFLAVVDTTQAGYPLLYLSYFGGSGTDESTSIFVDAAGFVYLAGGTSSVDFPLAGTNVQSTITTSGVTAGFVLKIDITQPGNAGLWYGTYLGGSANTTINGIAVDGRGLIDVIGTTRASDYPTTTSGYATSIYGPQDAFLSQIDPNAGVLVYSTFLGSELSDNGRAIALGPNGLIYFAISTNGSLFPATANQYQSTLHGITDGVVGVMDFTRSQTDSLIWDTYFGGSDADEIRDMAVDAKGNMVLTGYTLSTDFPVTADAAQRQPGGNGDAFVAVVNPTSAAAFLVYSTYLGGAQGDVAYGVTTDSAGSVYVTGYTLSPDFPATSDAPQAQWGNGVDIFVAKIKPGVPGRGGIQFATYLGGANVYTGTSIEVGADGTMYVGGYGGIGLPSSAAATQFGYAGGTADGFLIVMPQGATGAYASPKWFNQESRRLPR